jgi:hypothetical protein
LRGGTGQEGYQSGNGKPDCDPRHGKKTDVKSGRDGKDDQGRRNAGDKSQHPRGRLVREDGPGRGAIEKHCSHVEGRNTSEMRIA